MDSGDKVEHKWIEINWNKNSILSEIVLTFDTDNNCRLQNTERVKFQAFPEAVKDYTGFNGFKRREQWQIFF